MNTAFAWLSDDNPISAIERRWIECGALEQQDLALIVHNRSEHYDTRVRETCRVLLAAIDGKIDGEPHAQRLLIKRHVAVFRSKLRQRVATNT